MQNTVNKKLVLSLLGISILMGLLSLIHRQTGIDDAWLAEQAYWLVKDGVVRSELFRGMNDWEIQHLTYHRLLVWHGAVVNYLFGWSSYYFKAISLFYYLVFIFASYIYLKKSELLKDKSEYYLYFIFAIGMSLMIRAAFNYRSDAMAMTFGFLSFATLHLGTKKEDIKFYLAAGFFAGLSVVTHLNGMVFIFAGGLLLLFSKNIKGLVLFSITGGLTSLLYFADITSIEMFQKFLSQFRSEPALREHDFMLWGPIYKILMSYRVYFHKGSDISYTLLFIFIFWTQRRVIFANKDLKFIFMYFILISVSLAMISPEFKTLYLIYPAPFAFILFAVLFKNCLDSTVLKRRALITLTALFLLTNWGDTFKHFMKRTPDMPEMHAQISSDMNIPKGAKIIAPLEFIFNEIDKFTIQSFTMYYWLSFQNKINIKQDFFNLVSKDSRTHLILSNKELEVLEIPSPVKGNIYGKRYRYYGKFGPYHGFKLIDISK